MAKVKGTGPDSIRRLIKARGPEFEEAFLSKISPEERKGFENYSVVSKTEMKTAKKETFTLIAKMLYPDDLHPIRRLGYESALISVPVFYQIFIRIPSPNFVLKRVTALWKQYHDKGEAVVEDQKDNSCTIIVNDYPELEAFFREYLTGFYSGMLKLTGVKNYKAIQVPSDPNHWQWKLFWE